MKCEDLFQKRKIKTMNIKMAIKSQLSTIESKKQNKQTKEQKQNHRYGDNLDGYHLGEGRARMRKQMQRLRSTNWQIQDRQGMLRTVWEMEQPNNLYA